MNKEGEPLFLRLSHLLYRSAHARLEEPPTRFEQDVAGGEQGYVLFLGQFYGIRSGEIGRARLNSSHTSVSRMPSSA